MLGLKLIHVSKRGRRNNILYKPKIKQCKVKECAYFIGYTAFSKLSQTNALSLRQNGRHFADVIFKLIIFNENSFILIQITLKFVP